MSNEFQFFLFFTTVKNFFDIKTKRYVEDPKNANLIEPIGKKKHQEEKRNDKSNKKIIKALKDFVRRLLQSQ